MGIRFKKSVGGKGFRINLNKKSVGFTVGTKGANFTANSSGKITKSAGLPGTGLWYQDIENADKGKDTLSYSSDNIDSSGGGGDIGTPPTPTGGDEPPHKRNYKKIAIIASIVLLVLAGIGAALGEPEKSSTSSTTWQSEGSSTTTSSDKTDTGKDEEDGTSSEKISTSNPAEASNPAPAPVKNSGGASKTDAKKTHRKEAQKPVDSGRTVYWVDNGNVYHSTPDCQTLKRSRNIHSGTISQSGKGRPCKRCFH